MSVRADTAVGTEKTSHGGEEEWSGDMTGRRKGVRSWGERKIITFFNMLYDLSLLHH